MRKHNILKSQTTVIVSYYSTKFNLKYLGLSFWKSKEGWLAKPHQQSFKKLFFKLKKLVKRSWSIDLTYRIKKINEVLRSWINYYRKTSMKSRIEKLGEWLRNAIRVVIWKQWKLPYTRRIALIKLGLSENEAKCVSNARKGYQHICHCWSIT